MSEIKRYLVTIISGQLVAGATQEELPPGARVLTREQVESAMRNQGYWIISEMLDELFGPEEGT